MQEAPPRQETPPRHRAERRARWGRWVALLVLLSLVGLGIAATRYYDWCQGALGPQDPVRFEVRDGQSGSEIVDGL
ncbi:MAG TPA: hypothetical protein VFC08_05430, partial [Actinomycetota bacterium]|nr:hypothetical protein [Actinomycetota bacterium]